MLQETSLKENLSCLVQSGAGAGFVFWNSRDGHKVPINRGWNRPPFPSERDIQAALSLNTSIGVIPASLGLSVVDFDFGNPSDFLENFPPLQVFPTRRGQHALYALGRNIGAWKPFDLGEIRGEIIQRGFIACHVNPEGWIKKLKKATDVPFPLRPPLPSQLLLPWKKSQQGLLATVQGSLELETTQEGKRHNALLTSLVKTVTLKTIPLKHLESFARIENKRFNKPLSKKEVADMVTWVRQRALSFSKRQALRGKIGGSISRGGGRPSLGEPWKKEGISRRTWFRKNGTKQTKG